MIFVIIFVMIFFPIELGPRLNLVVVDLGWVDLTLRVPLSAQFCMGGWEFGRID